MPALQLHYIWVFLKIYLNVLRSIFNLDPFYICRSFKLKGQKRRSLLSNSTNMLTPNTNPLIPLSNLAQLVLNPNIVPDRVSGLLRLSASILSLVVDSKPMRAFSISVSIGKMCRSIQLSKLQLSLWQSFTEAELDCNWHQKSAAIGRIQLFSVDALSNSRGDRGAV